MYFDQGLRRGLSDFNKAQKLVVSYTWDVPSPKGLSGILGWASSGLEFGGILEASSGLPFTAVIAPDPLGMNSTDQFDLPDRVKGCNPIQGVVNYLNINYFTPPTAPISMAAQCVPNSFPGASQAPRTGTVYCANLLGNGGRNTLVGPGLVNLDFSLFKKTPIERISSTGRRQLRGRFSSL